MTTLAGRNSRKNRVVERLSIVRLRSGGPPMTVMTLVEGRVTCIWFTKAGEVQFYTFAIDCLKFC